MMYSGTDDEMSVPGKNGMEEMEQTTTRLDDQKGGASAEIADNGEVTIMQDGEHAITLSAERMYRLVIWAVDKHIHYLDYKAHEAEDVRCFECREMVGYGHKTYHLTDGDVTLCGPCAENVEETAREEIGRSL
jgi:formylmethanofuran dehydrogenase subunit E